MTRIRAVLFDWGNTLMRDLPGQHGPMRDWPHVEALPGALEALEALHAQGLRLALATNAADSGPADIRAALARCGLSAALEQIFCARELGLAKPARAFYGACLAGLDLPAEAVAMVGDDWHGDVQGALHAGLAAVWLQARRSLLPPVPDGACVTTIAALGELPELFTHWPPEDVG